MQIRDATPSDVPAVVRLLADSYSITPYSDIVASDSKSITTIVSSLMANPTGTLQVATTDKDEIIGVTGGMLYPMWMNLGHLTGQQVFWYVHPDHRNSRAGKKLLNALELWAVGAGAQSFVVASGNNKHRKRITQIFANKGYTDLEISFIKEL